MHSKLFEKPFVLRVTINLDSMVRYPSVNCCNGVEVITLSMFSSIQLRKYLFILIISQFYVLIMGTSKMKHPSKGAMYQPHNYLSGKKTIVKDVDIRSLSPHLNENKSKLSVSAFRQKKCGARNCVFPWLLPLFNYFRAASEALPSIFQTTTSSWNFSTVNCP